MKNLVFSIFYLLCSLFVFSTPVSAKVMMQEKGVIIVPATEVIDDDLFVGGESLDLAGTVNGSVFAGSANADISGTIKGDLVLGAGSVNISGTIGGDLYLGAGDVRLTKVKVGGNVIVASGNATIDETSSIGGSLIAGVGDLKNYASVGRNLMAGAGTMYLNSTVGKEVRVGGGTITLGPKAAIAGDLTYALGEEQGTYTQDPSATVAGTITKYVPPVDVQREATKVGEDVGRFGAMAHRGWLVISFVGSLLVGFLLIKLFPKTLVGLSTQVKDGLLHSLGIGFLIVIFTFPILLVLALTVVGLPLAGLLFGVFMIDLCLAKLVASYALGRFVATQFSWNKLGVYATFFVGLSIFYLLRAIPAAGPVVSILFTWTGLGAIWLYTRSHLKSL